MASETLTSGEYIKHHLQNLTFGQLPDGHWGFAHDAAQAKAMGFWAIHVDTMFFSLVTGLVFLYFFSKAAKRTPFSPAGPHCSTWTRSSPNSSRIAASASPVTLPHN